jgi:hypothetical protein
VKRLSLSLLLALPLLAACGGGKPVKKGGTLSPEEAAKIRERADQAHRSQAAHEARVDKSAMPVSAPEAPAAKAKILNTDARGCTWVEAVGVVMVGEEDSRNQFRASAINEARRVAMQDFLGVNVRSRFLDYQQEGLRGQKSVTESILLTTRQCNILDETVLEEDFRPLADCKHCRYGVTLKACILPTPDYADKEFEVELGISRNKLFHGDAAVLSVTCTKDCYVYVYDLWGESNTAMIVPNPQIPEVKLKAGEMWEYPDEAARKAGVAKLTAELPAGSTVSAETIKVVATKLPQPAKMVEAAEGYLAVLRRLNARRVNFVEDAQVFTIYKSK